MNRIVRFENRDCLELLKELPASSIDLMLQDPPYGVTQNEWDKEPPLPVMWPEWERVIKNNGIMIFFAQQPFASRLILSNLSLFRYDLIWYKPLASGFLNAKKMPLRNHEYMLIFYKHLPVYNPQMGFGIRKKGMRKQDRTSSNYGKFATDTSKYADDEGKRYPQSVIEVTNGDRTKESDHPTQKPIQLIRYLIRTYSNENAFVFDGYSGSGTTAEASLIEKRHFIGCELDAGYYADALKRIQERQRILTLF